MGVPETLLATAALWGYFFLLPFETDPDLATFFLVAIGLIAVYLSKGVPGSPGRIDLMVIAAVISTAAVSVALSGNPVQGLGYVVYLILNLFLLLLVTMIDRRQAAGAAAAILSAFGVMHLVALLFAGQVSGSGGPYAIIDQAGLATLVVPNDAIVLGLCLPSLMYVLLQGGRRRIPALVILALYVLLSVFVCRLLESKVALLSILTAVLLVPAVRFLPGRLDSVRPEPLSALCAILALLSLAAAAAWYLGNQSTTRLSLWLEAATSHSSFGEFLFGAGPNSFLYNPTAVKPLFDRGDLVIPWVHNLYLEAWHDLGLAGLVVFTALTLLPVIRALRIRDRNVGAMILGSMAVFILAAFLEITLTRRFYFAFLALFYGLALSRTMESNHEN